MAIVFDGRAYARKKEDELYHRIEKLGVTPVMATILVGDDPASKLYVGLKQKAAERVGVEMDVYELPDSISHNELVLRINHLNLDKNIHGMMIQLPLPGSLKSKTHDVVHHIARQRDVDGLRDDSPFMPATTRAVLSILAEAESQVGVSADDYVVVVGATGMVGKSVLSELTKLGYEVGAGISEAKNAKILISATGSPGIIKPENVKEGAVVIDVGSPKADVQFKEVAKKASFITPVPGGVGPVTVVSLLENLVEASEKKV